MAMSLLASLCWIVSGLNFLVSGNAHENFYQTCFNVPNAACLDGKTEVLLPQALPPQLAAYWSFNHLYSVDDSGEGNHFHPGFSSGPSVLGTGGSAYLHQTSSSHARTVSSKLNSPQFTISFWLYLLEDFTGKDRIFFSRGNEYSLSLAPNNRSLVVSLGGSTLYSQASFLLQRWTHVAVGLLPGQAAIYFNGILDQLALVQPPAPSIADIILGTPEKGKLGIEAYIDELRIYNSMLSAEEIHSLTIPVVTGISDPSLVKLGCLSCSETEIKLPSTCPGNYHICFKEDLYQYGFRIARIQGYLNSGMAGVWYGDAFPAQDNDSVETKEVERRLGLCCTGSPACAYAGLTHNK